MPSTFTRKHARHFSSEASSSRLGCRRVDQHVEPSELLDGIRDAGLDIGLIADIHPNRHRLAAAGDNLRGDALGGSFLVVGHHDQAAIGGEGFGGGLAHAAAGSDNQRHKPLDG